MIRPVWWPLYSPLARAITEIVRGIGFNPLSYFAAGEQGVWLDASDLTTLFQDSAGTTPVTAVGQPVGLWLDKSKGLVLGSERLPNTGGPFTSTTGWTVQAGGTLTLDSGRLKVVQASEWTDGIYGTAGSAVNPEPFWFEVTVDIGTASLIQVQAGFLFNNGSAAQLNITASGTYRFFGTNTSASIGLTFKASTAATFYVSFASVKAIPGNHFTQPTAGKRPMYVRFPAGGVRNLLLNTATLSTQNVTVTAAAHTLHFTGTGTVALSGTGSGSLVGTGASNRVSLTFTPTAGTLTLTVTGSVTAAQLELGSSVTGVQTVVSSADVTEAGVADVWAVKGDGVDDFLQTASIDFTATDKMTVWAGLRKLADTASVVTELSANWTANSGAFALESSGSYSAGARGAAAFNANQVATIAQSGADTVALTMTHDIAGDLSTVGRSGVAGTSGTGDKGTGNLGNQALYLLSRAGTSLFFSGHLSSLIVRGVATDAAGITNGEKWTAQRIGVTLP